MVNKFTFEVLDQTFRDIVQVDRLFGGKVFVFGGDFHQILLVIPYASHAKRQKQLANFLLKIGEDNYPIILGTKDTIELSSNIAIPRGKLPDLIDFVYPNLVKNSHNVNYIVSRAILTPKNDNVENISSLLMDQFPGELHTYPSTDDGV
ncbi:1714_t:CDS:2 [Racocetra persica]|uniref:1714_t:CDS:1 n=1 Tax=Racocetra persica TaxID=160502 RepID=A0ACA9L0V9_9GLOM|nr:1714_t:CDS:2 [Racocetra persica]